MGASMPSTQPFDERQQAAIEAQVGSDWFYELLVIILASVTGVPFASARGSIARNRRIGNKSCT